MDIDNVKRSCFQQCPRKFYWAHMKHLQPIAGSSALRFGATFHAALEYIYKHAKEHGISEAYSPTILQSVIVAAKEEWTKESDGTTFYPDYRTFEAAINLVVQYLNYYQNDVNVMEVTQTEIAFSLPITTDINYTGKIDLQSKIMGGLWNIDHKTTGQPIMTVSKTAHRSAQTIGYCFWAHEVGTPVEGSIANYAQYSARKSKATGMYGEATIDFMRVPSPYTKKDMDEWKRSFLYTCEQIHRCIDNDEWPMQFDSCYPYGGTCPYTILCEQQRSLKDTLIDGFIEKKWSPLS